MQASALATTQFMNGLRSLFQGRSGISRVTVFNNPWYLIAAVGLSACNLPETIPYIFRHALSDAQNNDERRVVANKMREALFKSGLTAGYSKVINSLMELYNATPDDLREVELQRDTSISLEDYASKGTHFFEQTYGSKAGEVQGLLDKIYPDMGFFSKTIGYGFTYSYGRHLTDVETSFVLVTSLIASDTPRQIQWHLDGATRNGASEGEVQAVREMAIKVMDHAGVTRRNAVPEI